jgi:hypothetical protein
MHDSRLTGVYPTYPCRGEGDLESSQPIDVGECEGNQDLARAGYTLTFRLARPPSNFTVPVTRANNV